MRCVIIAGSPDTNSDFLSEVIKPDDYVICGVSTTVSKVIITEKTRVKTIPLKTYFFKFFKSLAPNLSPLLGQKQPTYFIRHTSRFSCQSFTLRAKKHSLKVNPSCDD